MAQVMKGVCQGLADGKREGEGAREGQSLAHALMELIGCDLLMTL